MKMTFKEWLIEQSGRNDPVGDLADDVSRDEKQNKWKWNGQLKSVLSRIMIHDGSNQTRDVIQEAFDEFQRTQS